VTLIIALAISGIATGAIYGMLGTGLVLTYRTSGIFNFGHGALATAAAYVFYWLHIELGLNWGIALLLAVAVFGPILGLLMELLARRLTEQRTVWKVVGTVGLILIVESIGTIWYGSTTINVPQFLPHALDTIRVGGVNIGVDDITVLVISLVCVGALFVLFRTTRLGLAMRAVVEDPDLLALQRTDPIPVRRYSWIIGACLAALSGVLILPYIGLAPIVLTFLVVEAFGGAAIGFFSSIGLTFAGGLAIGILSAISNHYALSYSSLSGLPAGLPFIVLFVVLLVTPKRRLLPARLVEARPLVEWHGPRWSRMTAALVLLAFLAIVPTFAGIRLSFWTIGLTEILLFLSLGLLIRTAGLVSLCTTTFAAIGAVAFSQLAVDHGVPWLLALFIAGLVAVPVGALLAIPAIRLTGLFLALATFGFSLLVQDLFYSQGFMFSTLVTGRQMPMPSFASTGKSYYYLVLLIVVLATVGMVALHGGRLGRVLRGLGESPTAVSTLGLSVNVTRVIVFCIAAFLAAIAGVLYGSSVGFATGADPYFQPITSLILVATLALCTVREPWYAPLAASAAVIPGYITGANTTNWLNVAFGVFAIQVALGGGQYLMPKRYGIWMQKLTEHFPQWTQRLMMRWALRREHVPSAADDSIPPVSVTEPAVVKHAKQGQGGLVVRDLTVRFGGLVAVQDVSLEAELGQITGLIGPNGAGKTTTFNACSGLNRPSSGSVILHGDDVSSVGAAGRARRGLGRTFQLMQLCESLSVFDNVALGREAGQAGLNPFSQIVARPHEKRIRRDATLDALSLCGISNLARRQAGALSAGQRRLVELARCLAGDFDVLLLDEPSSGLDRAETSRFGEVLTGVVSARGCGILLVEHDMSLVMSICRYLYVLDSGKLLAEGDPEMVAANPLVQEAYLGEGSSASSSVVGATL